jgi:hypothetical protein
MKREFKRRSAIEPMIGHTKTDGRLGRNYLLGRDGDKINALLAASGHNLRLILKQLRPLFAWILLHRVLEVAMHENQLRSAKATRPRTSPCCAASSSTLNIIRHNKDKGSSRIKPKTPGGTTASSPSSSERPPKAMMLQ